MKKTVKQHALILAAFLFLVGSGFTTDINQGSIYTKGQIPPGFQPLRRAGNDAPSPFEPGNYGEVGVITHDKGSASHGSGYYNTLGIPELKAPVQRLPEYAETKVFNGPAPIIERKRDNKETEQQLHLKSDNNDPHRVLFLPASSIKPEDKGLSIPVVDNTIKGYYDKNEWEEERIFSSNLYTDSAIYNTHVKGNEMLSSKDEGTFYDINYRYELFTTRSGADSLSLNVDATYTNDKRAFNKGFTLNHFSLESNTERSRLVFGDAFPEMSQYTFTQGIVGAYGLQRFDNTSVSGFAGYYAPDKDDIRSPRYVGGFRLEHSKDDSFRIGFNFAGIDDKRDNSAAEMDFPMLYNRIFSIDADIMPTDNLYIDAEIARSETDYDKRNSAGRLSGDAYKLIGGFKNQNLKIEAGLEQADTEFAAPLGESPRDELSTFARIYYQLNRFISGRAGVRSSRDNVADYKSNTIKREQSEFQLTLRPSEYYKDMRFDFYYQPVHEFADNSSFMDRTKDMFWLEFNNKAGKMHYYTSLAQTNERDQITYSNDNDVKRIDLSLTWEYDDNNKVYGSYGAESTEYKRAGFTDKSRWFGFGGASRFNDNVLLGVDYLRENIEPGDIASVHDRLNLTITREYSRSSSVIIDLEGNKSEYADNRASAEDYTAKLRLQKAF